MSQRNPTRGRPRELRVDQAIQQATRELLGQVGYSRLTVEAVAGHAGVGKTAIYRRWPSKAELVFASTIHGLEPGAPPDTGSLRSDLAALLRIIFERLTSPTAAHAIPGLLADLAHHPELVERFQDTFIEHERTIIAVLLERARRRGELAELPRLELVHALLLGPVFAWLFLLRRPAAPDVADQLADLATPALIHWHANPPVPRLRSRSKA